MPHHRLLSTPVMRLATPEDTLSICAMPTAGRFRFVTDAAVALRGAAMALGTEAAVARDLNVVLFEIDDELAAAAALQRAMDPEIAQLLTLVLHQEMRGSHLREQPRPPFCAVVMEATMRLAAANGYSRIATHIANKDEKGLRLAKGFKFQRVGESDRDHGVWAARL